ncbi:MAG: DbpA RNA binding domain-containing protein, partial [Saprospiraceae bacterium]
KFELKEIPTGKEICRIRIIKLIDTVKSVHVDEEEIGAFIEQINKELEDLSREELIKKFVSMEFNRFLEYYRNSGDLNAAPGKYREDRGGRSRDRDRRGGDRRGGDRGGGDRGGGDNYSRFFINIGKNQKISPKDLIMLINKNMKGHTFGIGEIDLQKNFSFFEVDKGIEEQVIRGFKGTKFKDIKLNVEMASPKGGGSGRPPRKKKPHRKGGRGKKW